MEPFITGSAGEGVRGERFTVGSLTLIVSVCGWGVRIEDKVVSADITEFLIRVAVETVVNVTREAVSLGVLISVETFGTVKFSVRIVKVVLPAVRGDNARVGGRVKGRASRAGQAGVGGKVAS